MSALAVIDPRELDRSATVDTLTEWAHHELNQIDTLALNRVEHAVRVGQIFREVKRRLKHGEWGQWLADNFELHDRTAQRWMLVAERAEEDPTRVAEMAIREQRRALFQPEPKPEPVTPEAGQLLGKLNQRQTDDAPTIDGTAVEVTPEGFSAPEEKKWRGALDLLAQARDRGHEIADSSLGSETRQEACREAARYAHQAAIAFDQLIPVLGR